MQYWSRRHFLKVNIDISICTNQVAVHPRVHGRWPRVIRPKFKNLECWCFRNAELLRRNPMWWSMQLCFCAIVNSRRFVHCSIMNGCYWWVSLYGLCFNECNVEGAILFVLLWCFDCRKLWWRASSVRKFNWWIDVGQDCLVIYFQNAEKFLNVMIAILHSYKVVLFDWKFWIISILYWNETSVEILQNFVGKNLEENGKMWTYM